MGAVGRSGAKSGKGGTPSERLQAEVLRLAAAGAFEPAAALLAQGLRRRPRDAALLQLGGLIALQRQEPGEAARLLQRALAARAGDPAIATNLAIALAQSGADAKALQLLEVWTGKAPHFAPLFCNLGLLLRRSGRLAQAVEALRRAVTLDPDYVAARAALAASLLDLGHPRAALAEAEAALSRQPGLHSACYDAALAAAATGDDAKALAHLERLAGDPAADLQRGLALIRLGRQEDGEAALGQAVTRLPSLYPAAAKELVRQPRGRLTIKAGAFRRRLGLAV